MSLARPSVQAERREAWGYAEAVCLLGSATMRFTIVGEIRDIEPIALGRSVRVRQALRRCSVAKAQKNR